MGWIDYKKAYDMVQQTWIIEYRKMYKISDKVINSISKTMKNWKLELTAAQTLPEVKVQSCIFLGDSFSQMSFIIAMIPLN